MVMKLLLLLIFSLPVMAAPDMNSWMSDVESRLDALEAPTEPPIQPPVEPPINPPNQGVIELEAGTYSTAQMCPGGGQAIFCGQSDTILRPASGATAIVDCSQVTGWDSGTGDLVNATVEGLEFDCGGRGVAIKADRRGTRTNLVIDNNYVHDAAAGNTGVMNFGTTIGLWVINNRLEHTGIAGENNSHAIYHGGRGTNRNVHITGNSIDTHLGGRAIQVFGHKGGETLTDLFIENNVIRNEQGNAAILVSHSDGKNADGSPDREWIDKVFITGNQVFDSSGAAVELKSPGATITLRDNKSFNTEGLKVSEQFGPMDVIDAGGNTWQ